ncbi:alpha-ketoglutarate-dependent dioxygenase AlkB family protein [Mangrovibacterium lignilyticum]|uniref:alpha-ketoglutarate-dependent dioxygenase AlkB family protein n=1 Tax=Mangrovibacterium lignilyticum TaxID=2668052 RepID=UPI0013D7D682|nr:alpha-ketoglutarate-dependent dioxygenase AlkB [Mangrovibacterium lignilyticum]
MNLFRTAASRSENLLPFDGTVEYYGCVLSPADANGFYERLLQTIDWKNDEAILFGKKIITKRKVAWYGDKPFRYTYSNTNKFALPWTDDLLALKQLCEQQSGESYNSCLLNLYHDGSEGMAWHSDGEKDLKPNGAIASFTLGAERRFSFKHKQSKETRSLLLEHGSLLVMKDETQTYWLHRLPPTKTIHTPRINLTFRTITGQ